MADVADGSIWLTSPAFFEPCSAGTSGSGRMLVTAVGTGVSCDTSTGQGCGDAPETVVGTPVTPPCSFFQLLARCCGK